MSRTVRDVLDTVDALGIEILFVSIPGQGDRFVVDGREIPVDDVCE